MSDSIEPSNPVPAVHIGRPTKYRPEFCERVIEFGKLGYSYATCADQFDVTTQSLDNWRKIYPEFDEALQRWRTAHLAWWEEIGRVGMCTGKFSGGGAQVWTKSMVSRFHDEYREQRAVEMSGPGGAPLAGQSQTVYVIAAPEAAEIRSELAEKV